MNESFHIRIYGKVQGVGYRAWMIRKAQSYELCGWVRNRSDGSVEALACGTSEQVAGMIASCWEGPVGAKVELVEHEPTSMQAQEAGFQQLPTV